MHFSRGVFSTLQTRQLVAVAIANPSSKAGGPVGRFKDNLPKGNAAPLTQDASPRFARLRTAMAHVRSRRSLCAHSVCLIACLSLALGCGGENGSTMNKDMRNDFVLEDARAYLLGRKRLNSHQAFQVLLHASCFLTPNVPTPIEVRAFHVVLDDADAESQFGALIEQGTPSGQLYGLCGLYLLNRASFEERVGQYHEDTRVVECWFADLVEDRTVAEVIRTPNDVYPDIVSGEIPQDLANPWEFPAIEESDKRPDE